MCTGSSVVCPRQLQTVDGKYYAFENENVIRLYEFIPGKILCDVEPCANLIYQVGLFTGKLDGILKVLKICTFIFIQILIFLSFF
jgi:hypothetical protein